MGIIYRRGVVVSLLAALLSLLPAAALAARQSLIAPLDRSKVTAPRFDIKSVATPIAIDRKRIAAIARNDEMDLPLPDGKSFVVTFDRVEDHGGGIVSSVGYLRDHGKDYRVIITNGPGGTFGSIRTPAASYQIVPGQDADWIVNLAEEAKYTPHINLGNDFDIADTRATPFSEEDLLPGDGTKHSAIKAAPQDFPAGGQATIDLMIVYTNGLADRLGIGLMTRLYNLVTAANTAYFDSEVAITLRLVNATMVNYSDTATSDLGALNAIRPSSGGGTGVFANVETIRNASGADLVAFLRNGGDFSGSGIATLTVNTVSPNPLTLYSVTTGCVVGCNSVFIHELGHNMGNAHDRATSAAEQKPPTGTPSPGAYSYSFGHYYCATGALSCNPFVANGCAGALPQCSDTTNMFTNPNNVGTIMSYFDPVTLKFSNPNLLCAPAGGGAPSQACGVAGQADNALSMNNMRFVLQNVKAATVAAPTGALQFSATSFSAPESSGQVVISVSRVGGSGGAVSVNYASQDGSAKAGFDYTATSGTLNWADGDAANKTFVVPIVNDGVTEGNEFFTVVLSNASGATGTFLGFPTIATAAINEATPWPPGGSFPAGYITPSGSGGSWTTATDFAFEGATSLRSAQMVGDGLGGFTTSDVSFTGAFATGLVTFAYRVSSYGNVPGIVDYGFFDFVVDGTTVFSATGESGWQPYSYAIAAGPHTLTWRYRSNLGARCNLNFSPPSPGGANCADRAWIDAVSLPLALTGSNTALGTSGTPSAIGAAVTFTATVTGAAGTPAGVVNFKDNGAVIAGCSLVTTSGGVATCTTSSLTVGAHTITAEYSGNSTYDTSVSAPLTQTVSGVLLTVAKSGTGSGTVSGTGISCGVDCTEGFAPGTMVTLTAAPAVGSIFAGWSGGGCTGTGSCTVTVNAATTVTAAFTALVTLTVTSAGTGTGTITGTGINCGVDCSETVTPGTVVLLTATPAGTSSFAGWSGGGCSGTGTCSLTVSAATTVTATFVDLPGPPTAVFGVAGNGSATISFTPPTGVITPITGYTATCAGVGGASVSGLGSPIVVSPLTNGNTYSCSVTATNANGTGAASSSVAVMPSLNPSIALTAVTSRKNHGTAGDQDLPVLFATPLAGAITVEPRTNSGGHVLRFTFNVPVNSVGTATVTDGTVAFGSASATADGSNVVTATLTGVPDNSRALVSISGVNGTYLAQATIGFLVGDVNGLGSVSASDLSAIKARNGQSATTASKFDLNRSGTVDGNDVSVAKARSGLRLPP